MTDKAEGLRYLAGLLEKNDAHAREQQALYKSLREGQKPKVVIALCADSRLQTCMFGDSLDLVGSLFVGRDIGNSYSDSEGAVDYAVRHLKVPVLFIMGHTGCGAAAAARGDYSEETQAIRARLEHMSISGDEAHAPQANVDAQVKLALETYKGEVSGGRLAVLGGIFDLLGLYGGPEGKVYLTNLNGMTHEGEIGRGLADSGAFPQGVPHGMVKRI